MALAHRAFHFSQGKYLYQYALAKMIQVEIQPPFVSTQLVVQN